MKKVIFILVAMAIIPVYAASAQETEYELGVTAYMVKDYEKAITHLKKYIQETPEAKAYYIIGYALYALERSGRKDFGESATYFKQAYLIDPEFDPESIGFSTE